MLRSAGGAGVPPALVWLAPKKSVAGETPTATVPLDWDGKTTGLTLWRPRRAGAARYLWAPRAPAAPVAASPKAGWVAGFLH